MQHSQHLPFLCFWLGLSVRYSVQRHSEKQVLTRYLGDIQSRSGCGNMTGPATEKERIYFLDTFPLIFILKFLLTSEIMLGFYPKLKYLSLEMFNQVSQILIPHSKLEHVKYLKQTRCTRPRGTILVRLGGPKHLCSLISLLHIQGDRYPGLSYSFSKVPTTSF